MKTSKTAFMLMLCIFVIASVFSGCNQEEESFANVSINETGSDVGGDVTGDGGSIVKNYLWNNSLTTVEFNMDITAAKGGSFNLKIADPDGNLVVDQTLVVGQGDDSKSGVSLSGITGQWSIVVTLTNFVGDGSFSLSPGN